MNIVRSQSHSAENRDCFGRNYEKILAMTAFQENVTEFTDYLRNKEKESLK